MVSLIDVRFEVAVAFIVIVGIYVIRQLWRKSPGPPKITGLPIVGYLPFLTRHPHIKLMELGKKYGGVFSVRLGSKDVLVLHSIEAAREAFSKNEFLGRPPQSAFALFGTTSPFFMDDMRIWEEQGKFVLQSLKDLGLGKTKIEGLIQEEIDYFLESLGSHNGEPFPIYKYLTPSLSNNICALIFGERYTYDHPERLMLDRSLDAVIKIVGQTAAHIFFPWMKYVPFLLKWFELEKGVAAHRNIQAMIEKKIQEHKETLDPGNIRDLIDGYLIEMASQRKKDRNTTFTEHILTGTVLDMFGAGSESVRTSVSWCIYTMAAYPEVQKKVQKEISEVLGTDRTPEYLDLKLMPYTHSVMLEVLRWKTLVPLNALRYTTNDTTVLGYAIPKGTTVTANFWAIHHDPELWDDPESFVPERFLSPDGKSVQKSPNFVLFSIGKRACPGETMAYIEIFLYFASILQKFEIQLPEGVQPTFDPELAVTYRRKPYEIRMVSRN